MKTSPSTRPTAPRCLCASSIPKRSITIDLGATAESVFNAQLQTDVSDDGGVLVFI